MCIRRLIISSISDMIPKDVINCTSNRNSSIKEIHCNHVTLTDPVPISKSFNEYLVNIGPNLASNIPQISIRSSDYLKNANPASIFISPTDSAKLISITSLLEPNTSPRKDGEQLNDWGRVSRGKSVEDIRYLHFLINA